MIEYLLVAIGQLQGCISRGRLATLNTDLHMGVDLKVLVLSVVCDDLLYAKMTFGES